MIARRSQPCRLKNCTARSWRSAAPRDANVPRLRRRPVRGSTLREYKRYFPVLSLRIMRAPRASDVRLLFRRNAYRVLALVVTALELRGIHAAAQQTTATVRVVVRSDREAVADARVAAGGAESLTDRAGSVTLTIPAGSTVVTVTKDGYLPATVSVEMAPGERRDLAVDLQRLEEEVIVTAARTNTR